MKGVFRIRILEMSLAIVRPRGQVLLRGMHIVCRLKPRVVWCTIHKDAFSPFEFCFQSNKPKPGSNCFAWKWFLEVINQVFFCCRHSTVGKIKQMNWRLLRTIEFGLRPIRQRSKCSSKSGSGSQSTPFIVILWPPMPEKGYMIPKLPQYPGNRRALNKACT